MCLVPDGGIQGLRPSDPGRGAASALRKGASAPLTRREVSCCKAAGSAGRELPLYTQYKQNKISSTPTPGVPHSPCGTPEPRHFERNGAMKTCVLYGPKVLRIEERPVSEPEPGFVRLRMGGVGICGSDLHYYHIGRVGNAVVREPMILGHELSGVVDAIGPGVSGLVPGQKVIINPTDECGTCGYCRSGHQNLCPDLRYYGSAARTPHVQGIMVEYPLVQARQCVAVSDAMPLEQAACVEPLAIALHAVARAGNLLGKRVFVSGAGPVGCLIAAVARLNGAASVAVSDMEEFPLSVAVKLGADAVFKATDPTLADLANGCEACFEASGSVGGMNTCLRSAAPGGTVVHVGFLGEEEVAYPINTMVIRKEVTVCGSLRAYQEFPLAARLVESGRLDLSPLITASYPLEKAEEAILAASDKTRSMKVVLTGPAL